MRVLHDQREKKPWDIPGVDQEAVHLETGDYTIEGYEDCFAVERKSINDLATSVGATRENFEAEIERAQSMTEFVVLIEGSKQDIRNDRYYSNISANSVLGTTEKWPYKYGTLDFIWAGENQDGKRVRSMSQARDHAAEECLRLLDRWLLIAESDLL